MSSSKIVNLLDANGNINNHFLQKELQESLIHDVTYRQTDNAKKRAVKTSANYDEFKAKVSCAQLKTLKRDEIESLKNIKRGWKKSAYTTDSSPTILSPDVFNVTTSQINSSKSKIKTIMEVERDINRLSSSQDKLRYLNELGCKKFIKLFNQNDSVELFETVLNLYTCTSFDIMNNNTDVHEIKDSSPVNTTTNNNVSYENNDQSDTIANSMNNTTTTNIRNQSYIWIQTLTTLHKFDTMKLFLSSSLKFQVINYLITYKNDIFNCTSDVTEEQINETIRKYE